MTTSQISALTTGAGIALLSVLILMLLVREAARQHPALASRGSDDHVRMAAGGDQPPLPSRWYRIARSAPSAWLIAMLTALFVVDVAARFAVLGRGS